MWQQNYTPLFGSVGISALVAALPLFTLLFLLGVLRKPAWVSALSGLAAAALVAILAYGMPAGLLASSIVYGAFFGFFPIGWIVFWAVVLYRITVETGKFEVVKDSVGSLTHDRRLQALLIAFALAAPLAWWVMNKWLNSFVYRVEPGVGIFTLAMLITFVVALLTVGFQSTRAALANPVKSLRSE